MEHYRMRNQFLQFIKKQKLAIRLAKFDSLFAIENLSAFRKTLPLAKLFRCQSEQNPIRRLQRFLDSENNPLLNAVYEELTSRTDILPAVAYLQPVADITLVGDVLARTIGDLGDVEFYLNLFAEIINSDYPELAEQLELFQKRLDAITDMRFYASELEMLCAEVAAFERGCPFEIDWIKSNKEKLYLYFEKSYEYSVHLPLSAQESLSRLFGYLIFEKAIFISSWNGVGYNRNGQVCLLDFDYLYPVSPSLRQYAIDYLTKGREPILVKEFKMRRALQLLEEYCPNLKVFKFWKAYFSQEIRQYASEAGADRQFVKNLEANGLGFCAHSQIMVTDPEEISYLLDSHRHKEDSQYKKSSIFYWGPLALVLGWLILH